MGDIQQREGVPHLRVEGKGEKVRHLPRHPAAVNHFLPGGLRHAGELHGPLFRLVKNTRTKTLAKPLHSSSVYHNVVKRYARELDLTDASPASASIPCEPPPP